jgi:hypothetical protein
MSGDEIIEKAIKILDALESKNSSEAYVLKYKGKILKLSSGKSLWSRKNHATSAFTNEIYLKFHKYKDGWTQGEVTKLLLEKGILTLEKVNG